MAGHRRLSARGHVLHPPLVEGGIVAASSFEGEMLNKNSRSRGHVLHAPFAEGAIQ
jgi:dihydroxyacetone kinase DhaKLM complex PTS-EIIA-like component DhaM